MKYRIYVTEREYHAVLAAFTEADARQEDPRDGSEEMDELYRHLLESEKARRRVMLRLREARENAHRGSEMIGHGSTVLTEQAGVIRTLQNQHGRLVVIESSDPDEPTVPYRSPHELEQEVRKQERSSA